MRSFEKNKLTQAQTNRLIHRQTKYTHFAWKTKLTQAAIDLKECKVLTEFINKCAILV